MDKEFIEALRSLADVEKAKGNQGWAAVLDEEADRLSADYEKE